MASKKIVEKGCGLKGENASLKDEIQALTIFSGNAQAEAIASRCIGR